MELGKKFEKVLAEEERKLKAEYGRKIQDAKELQDRARLALEVAIGNAEGEKRAILAELNRHVISEKAKIAEEWALISNERKLLDDRTAAIEKRSRDLKKRAGVLSEAEGKLSAREAACNARDAKIREFLESL